MSEKEIEELARQYIDSCTERNGFVILTEGIKSDFIDLFVAGFMKCLELKAGGQKWHKVADGDLPTEEKQYILKFKDGTIDILYVGIDGNLEPFIVTREGFENVEKWSEIPKE